MVVAEFRSVGGYNFGFIHNLKSMIELHQIVGFVMIIVGVVSVFVLEEFIKCKRLLYFLHTIAVLSIGFGMLIFVWPLWWLLLLAACLMLVLYKVFDVK